MSQTDAELAKIYKSMLKWSNLDDFQQRYGIFCSSVDPLKFAFFKIQNGRQQALNKNARGFESGFKKFKSYVIINLRHLSNRGATMGDI